MEKKHRLCYYLFCRIWKLPVPLDFFLTERKRKIRFILIPCDIDPALLSSLTHHSTSRTSTLPHPNPSKTVSRDLSWMSAVLENIRIASIIEHLRGISLCSLIHTSARDDNGGSSVYPSVIFNGQCPPNKVSMFGTLFTGHLRSSASPHVIKLCVVGMSYTIDVPFLHTSKVKKNKKRDLVKRAIKKIMQTSFNSSGLANGMVP